MSGGLQLVWSSAIFFLYVKMLSSEGGSHQSLANTYHIALIPSIEKKKQINIFKRKITASRLSLVSVVLCHLDTLLYLESLMFVALRLGVGLKEGKTKKNQ